MAVRIIARQAKKEFKLRRGSHYSGEGEVMKRFRARASAADDEEDESEDTSAIDTGDAEDDHHVNEARRNARANSTSNGSISGIGGANVNGSSVPPIPPIPNGMS